MNERTNERTSERRWLEDVKTPAAKKQRVDESGAAVPTSSGKKTQSIASLNPYMGNWTVKAKLSSKGNIRTFRNARGEGRVCTIELVDEAGTAIQAGPGSFTFGPLVHSLVHCSVHWPIVPFIHNSEAESGPFTYNVHMYNRF